MKSLAEVLVDWEAIIGLEVHAELTALETKMFCGCKLSHNAAPNTNVCPICLGFPGAMPVPNEQAIRSIVKVGLATNCSIQRRSMFYRKHYFYPDMAKNYQITQGPVAFCMHGLLELDVRGESAAERPEGTVHRRDDGSYAAPIRILRIHMEEDAAKMVHVGGSEGRISGATESLIDYNRCGTPLIELVTEPDLRTPEEARLFMEKLRQIYLAIGISDCSLENGSMRCDGNVSLRRRGTTEFGPKTEMKNLNSFKSLHDALEYEICRQAEVLERGGIVYQETRHWEPSRKRTVVMRRKETADDYRFFPDPDLAPFNLSEEFIESVRAELPELPDAKAARYCSAYGLKHAEAQLLAGEPATAAFFEEALAMAGEEHAKAVANVCVNLVPAYPAATNQQAAELACLLAEGALVSSQAREVLEAVSASGESVLAYVDSHGIRQSNDAGALQPVVNEVLARCGEQVQQYRDGNEKVLGYLLGQCMRASEGRGNPKLFKQLLLAELEETE